MLAVDLHLRLAGATRADAAAQTGHGLAPPPEARQEVVQLGQLDLHATLSRARVKREDVEDQSRPVDHLHAEALLERAELPGREFLVEDDRVGAAPVDHVVELGELALPDVGGGIRVGTVLDEPCYGIRPGRVRQGRKLVEVFIGDPFAHADEDRLLTDGRARCGRQRRFEDLPLSDRARPRCLGFGRSHSSAP